MYKGVEIPVALIWTISPNKEIYDLREGNVTEEQLASVDNPFKL